MKKLIFLFVGFNSVAFAYESYPERDPWQIVSSKEDPSLGAAEYRLSGTVTYSGLPLVGGYVTTENSVFHTQTDSAGNFVLVVDTTKDNSDIYFEGSFTHSIRIPRKRFKTGFDYTVLFFPRSNYDENQMVKKPVIYCYSDVPLTANVKVQANGEISFVFPGNLPEWELSVDSEGLVFQNDGLRYPYLFWEARQANIGSFFSKSESERLATDTVVSWLEDRLILYGLNSRERTDFITFWAPQMQEYRFIQAQWFLDDQCEVPFSTLTINPKPDVMKRVFILFEGFDTSENIGTEICAGKALEVSNPERTGFTVIEWGGAEVQTKKIAD